MDPRDPKAPKKDLLAELNLADLFKCRAEAAEKQKEATDRLNDVKAGHFVAKHLKSIDDKIAFCHLVQDEAKRVKVRRYAEALVEKELS